MNTRIFACSLLLILFLSGCGQDQSGWLGTSTANEKIHLASSSKPVVTVPTGASNLVAFSASIALGASNEDITFSPSGLPNGATAVFTPSSCKANFSVCPVTMMVSVATTTPVGETPISIVGTGVTSQKATILPATLIVLPTLTVFPTPTGGTITQTPSGTDCSASCTVYSIGTPVNLTATPDTGFRFVGWNGACSGTTCSLTMDAAKTVSAQFALQIFPLTVTPTGAGSGTVVSDTGGINCGAICTATYNINTQVTLTATSTLGSTFAGWSGAGCSGIGVCTVKVDAIKNVTAGFNKVLFPLTVKIVGSGRVTSDINGIECGAKCSENYSSGTGITLGTTPVTGGAFMKWSGDCSGATCTLTMDGPKAVTAEFALAFKTANFLVGTSTKPNSIAIDDLSGDGKFDLVVGLSDQTSKKVYIFMGNGDGSFGMASTTPAGMGPNFVVIGDFNGDGYRDIAVANQYDSSGNVSVLLGNDTGLFLAQTPILVGREPMSIAMGYLNNDANVDIVTANQDGNVSVLLGAGTLAKNYETGNTSFSVTLRDIDKDDKIDIIAANLLDDTVSVLLGNGDGTFKPTTNFPVGTVGTATPYSVAVSDLDKDGNLDIITANNATSTVSILWGYGLDSFSSPEDVSVGKKPRFVTTGDLNGDGNVDIVTANFADNNVSVLLGDGNRDFQPAVSFATGSGPSCVAIKDLNKDGKVDLVVTNSTNGNVSVLLNQ